MKASTGAAFGWCAFVATLAFLGTGLAMVYMNAGVGHVLVAWGVVSAITTIVVACISDHHQNKVT